jgi:hypothetical protein
VVNLVSGDTSEATVPASVTIPAGQASANFAVSAVDDALVDGTTNVTITAGAGGYTSGNCQLAVTDNDNDIVVPGDDFADEGQWTDAGAIPISPASGEGQIGGQIEQPVDKDLFKFIASQGGATRIVVLPSTGNVTPVVRVYDATGKEISCNDRDAGGGFRAWMDLEAGGAYYVEVAGGGGAGAYAITVDTTPTPSFRLGTSAGLPAAGYVIGSDGRLVTISYSGPGIAEIFVPLSGGGIETLAVNGATAKSSLTIKTQKGAVTAPVGDVFIHGSIKSLAGATTNLLGRLEVNGSLGKLVLNDASKSEIHIGPRSAGDTKTEASLSLGRISDLSVFSQTPIKSIRAIEWLDTDSTEDVIQAPSLGTVTITGRKASAKAGLSALAGDLAAGMLLTDAARKQTLGGAKVAGAISDAFWQIAGNAGSIVAAATGADWNLQAGGYLAKVNTTGDIAGTIHAARIGAIGGKGVLRAAISAADKDAKGVSIGELKAGMVSGISVASPGGVAKISTSRWSGGEIRAGWIGSIKTAANSRLGGDGDFDADVTLSGQWTPVGKAVLGSVGLSGDLGGNWSVTGNLGSMKVAGTADHARVQASGTMASIRLGASDGSDFLSGVSGGARHAQTGGDFNPAGSINNFKITGLKMPKGTPPTRFMKDTNISAARLGTVSLLNAEDVGNGLYVLRSDTGGEIKSAKHKDTQYPENNWSYPPHGLFTGPDILHFL